MAFSTRFSVRLLAHPPNNKIKEAEIKIIPAIINIFFILVTPFTPHVLLNSYIRM
jgi:hypothetical protein